eukprot:gene21613-27652_t
MLTTSHCDKVETSHRILKSDVQWGDILAVTSSETHLFVASTQLGVSQINLQSGQVTSIPLVDTAVSSIHFVAEWNKLFVGTKTTLYTLTFSDAALTSYTSEHEWITGVIDDIPLQFAYDSPSDTLWMAETGAVHKLDTTGRWWRFGYHQGAPFGNISSVAVSHGYVYVGSSLGGLARLKTDTNPGQIDTLNNNQPTVMISGDGGKNAAVVDSDPWMWSFFGGQRWLPDNKIVTLVAAKGRKSPQSSVVLIASQTGLTYLESALFTLSEKATVFSTFQSPRHDRHGLTADCRLTDYANLQSYVKKVGDNDGLWTSMHVMGEAYSYAATGDTASRDLAWRGFEALERLVVVTGDYPKFPARSYCYLAEGDSDCGTDSGADRWHNSTTIKGVMWKDDTSSDEMNGHFAALPVVFDLVAQTQDEKDRVYALIDGIMQGIVDNDLYLVDPSTNLPTKWGFWNPSAINDDAEHYSERGLNSLEILGYLASAYSVTRKVVYRDTFFTLVNDHGYVKNLMNVKIDNPGDDNHSDNELISLAYHVMFYSWRRLSETEDKQFKDELWSMVSLTLPSLHRTYQLIGTEFSPLWTGIFAGVAAQPATQSAITRSVWSLRHWALDLIAWPIDNSNRWDLTVQPFFARNSETEHIMREIRPPQERESSHANRDPYEMTGGSGSDEFEPAVWRLPYNMMLYYKLI